MFAFCHVLECSWEKKKEGESQKERERERSIKRETMSVKVTKRENTDRKSIYSVYKTEMYRVREILEETVKEIGKGSTLL